MSNDLTDLLELSKNGATIAGFVYLIFRGATEFVLRLRGTFEERQRQQMFERLFDRIDQFSEMYERALDKLLDKLLPPTDSIEATPPGTPEPTGGSS